MGQINIGDSVVPLSNAGLWLANEPVNGVYKQQRNNTCVFIGVGKVIDICICIIDYDEWDRFSKSIGEDDCVPYNIGKIEFTDYLIQCENGVGWGSGVEKCETDSLTTVGADNFREP